MKRIVKKQLKLQEKSLEKFLDKKEIVISNDESAPVRFVHHDNDDAEDDEGFLSKIGSIFQNIFDNLLEILVFIAFGGAVTYFIINEEFRTFIINFIDSLIK